MKYPWVPRRTERLSRQQLHDCDVTCSLHGGFYFENWMDSLCCSYIWLPDSFICIFTHRVKWVPSAPTISNKTRKNIKNRRVNKTSVFHWKLKKQKQTKGLYLLKVESVHECRPVAETHCDVELLQGKQLMIHLHRPQQLLRAVHQLQRPCEMRRQKTGRP